MHTHLFMKSDNKDNLARVRVLVLFGNYNVRIYKQGIMYDLISIHC